MKWGAYPVISSVPSNNNGERREMEPFHEVQITLCVFNKTSDKNLKSPDAQTLNAPWSTVRHSQCSVKSKQNGIILRESYCCAVRFAFSSDKRNILFSVLTTWLTTQGRVSHFVSVSGVPWCIHKVWFWCQHRDDTRCHYMMSSVCHLTSAPLCLMPRQQNILAVIPALAVTLALHRLSAPRVRAEAEKSEVLDPASLPARLTEARSQVITSPSILSPKVTDPMKDRIFTGGEEGRDNSIKEQLKVSAWGSQNPRRD